MESLDRERVLRADIDIGLVRADCVGGDGHALENPVRVRLQDRPIHEGARIAFVGVADDVFLGRGHLGDGRPFQSGRIAAAAASTQTAVGHFAQDIGRGHLAQGPDQGRVTADGHIALEAVGIDDAGILQHDLLLAREEGLIRRTAQTFHGWTVEACDDVGGVIRGDVAIEGRLFERGIPVGDRHQGAGRAESHASDPFDLARRFAVPEAGEECIHDGCGAGRLATGGHADADLALDVRVDGTVLLGQIGQIVEVHQVSSSSLAMSDSLSSLPSTSPSMTIAGARPQAPTQRAVNSDSRLSSVVSPGLMS